MELLPNIIAENTALYLKKAKTLILSDLHIGYEEERRSRGVLLPQEQKRWFKEELDRLFKALEIKRVILAGDIKHEFGTISKEEWFDVQEIIKNIEGRGTTVDAVGGNHDMLVKPILNQLKIELKKSLIIKNGRSRVLILHGDKTLSELETEERLSKASMKRVDTIIIGHEHPAMRITDGMRNETVKCFLVGKYQWEKRAFAMIVVPSWNPLAFGTDIIRERPLGPLLKRFDDFSAFALVERKVLAFGVVEQLQRLSIMNK